MFSLQHLGPTGHEDVTRAPKAVVCWGFNDTLGDVVPEGNFTRHQQVPGDGRQQRQVEFSKFNERRTNPNPLPTPSLSAQPNPHPQGLVPHDALVNFFHAAVGGGRALGRAGEALGEAFRGQRWGSFRGQARSERHRGQTLQAEGRCEKGSRGARGRPAPCPPIFL